MPTAPNRKVRASPFRAATVAAVISIFLSDDIWVSPTLTWVVQTLHSSWSTWIRTKIVGTKILRPAFRRSTNVWTVNIVEKFVQDIFTDMNDDMKTSPAGLEFISKWEGCILKPYKDIAGLRTIGIGHLILPNENFPDGVSITKEQALGLLAKDVEKCEVAIKKNVKVVLNQNQFDALCSFGFNCGTGVYSSSNVATALNTGNYGDVPAALLAWSKAKINGVLQVNQGLLNRRKSEGELFMKPAGVSDVPPADPVMKWTPELLKEAQGELAKRGLYTIKVDGLWGPGTLRALTSFSSSKNLSMGPDPKSGVPTSLWTALKS